MLLFSKVLFCSHLTTTVLLSFVYIENHACVWNTDAPRFELISLYNRAKPTTGAFSWDDSWVQCFMLCSALLQFMVWAMCELANVKAA